VTFVYEITGKQTFAALVDENAFKAAVATTLGVIASEITNVVQSAARRRLLANDVTYTVQTTDMTIANTAQTNAADTTKTVTVGTQVGTVDPSVVNTSVEMSISMSIPSSIVSGVQSTIQSTTFATTLSTATGATVNAADLSVSVAPSPAPSPAPAPAPTGISITVGAYDYKVSDPVSSLSCISLKITLEGSTDKLFVGLVSALEADIVRNKYINNQYSTMEAAVIDLNVRSAARCDYSDFGDALCDISTSVDSSKTYYLLALNTGASAITGTIQHFGVCDGTGGSSPASNMVVIGSTTISVLAGMLLAA